MESNIEYAVEEDMSVDDFIEEYKAYASEKDIQDIITMFNEQKKEYDEQEFEVE
jgi:pyruvate/2-oxoacid:ferredoxin oxidoreductase alpha subunit